MTPRVLFAWLGRTDINASGGAGDLGPILRVLIAEPLTELVLLANYPAAEVAQWQAWATARTATAIHLHPITLPNPNDFGAIYRAAAHAIDAARRRHPHAPFVYHLSPGTSAMAAIWLLLAKTSHPAGLLRTSIQDGVTEVDVPFDLAADFLPQLLARPDARLRRHAGEPPPTAPAFSAIVHRSPAMARVIRRATRVAPRRAEVLILGESGTGKELLARAIHTASGRRGRFVALNCGALAPELIDSELFGHEKGAFTGAHHLHRGVFEQAHGGTLFLDEVGELTLPVQVRLLRALQEGRIRRVGAQTERPVDVRIIAATHRDLLSAVQSGAFREDLFFRLAVAVLRLPPLRERAGGRLALIDHLLAQINEESADEPGYRPRTLSAAARQALLAHPWPGNVRELRNTLRRACLWSDTEQIDRAEIAEALLPLARPGDQGLLGRALGGGLDINQLVIELKRHYLTRAWEASGGNKAQTARLLGVPNYQTVAKWLRQLGVESE